MKIQEDARVARLQRVSLVVQYFKNASYWYQSTSKMQSNAVFARAHIFSDSRSSAHAKATTEHALIYFYVCMCVCMCISDTSMHVCMHALKGFFCKNAGLEEDDSDGC